MVLHVTDLPVGNYMTAYPISVLPDVKIKEVTQQPFVKIKPDTSILDAAKSMISKKARLLVFADSDKLVGIVTASDLVRAFRRTYVAPSLEEVVSKKIHRMSFNESILDAVQMMFEKGIGSVIVEGSQSDYGIVTARDIVEAYQNESPHIKNY